MNELVFLKLGGSLLTDKTSPQALRSEVLARLADEIALALLRVAGLRLVIGHGSGSFGHVTASKYSTRAGVRSAEEWRGYADTALDARKLNHYVLHALRAAGVPVLPLQPSASALCHDGELRCLDERPVRTALVHGLAPVVYGDVALDEVRGGTIISTEDIFGWLAPRLAPDRVVLLGEVAGVYAVDPATWPAWGDPGAAERAPIGEITPAQLPSLVDALGASRGIDVTGGMIAKVTGMLGLVQRVPSLREVHIVSGLEPGLLQAVLAVRDTPAGTRIHR